MTPCNRAAGPTNGWCGGSSPPGWLRSSASHWLLRRTPPSLLTRRPRAGSKRVFDGINIDKPGRPTIGVGNQGGGHDDVSGFSASSLVGVEPDVDADSMGDETHDADGGGLGTDWVDDLFEDFEEPAQLDG
jgi:hypothetical protein